MRSKLVKTLVEFFNLVKHTLGKLLNLVEPDSMRFGLGSNLFDLFGEANGLLNALKRICQVKDGVHICWRECWRVALRCCLFLWWRVRGVLMGCRALLRGGGLKMKTTKITEVEPKV